MVDHVLISRVPVHAFSARLSCSHIPAHTQRIDNVSQGPSLSCGGASHSKRNSDLHGGASSVKVLKVPGTHRSLPAFVEISVHSQVLTESHIDSIVIDFSDEPMSDSDPILVKNGSSSTYCSPYVSPHKQGRKRLSKGSPCKFDRKRAPAWLRSHSDHSDTSVSMICHSVSGKQPTSPQVRKRKSAGNRGSSFLQVPGPDHQPPDVPLPTQHDFQSKSSDDDLSVLLVAPPKRSRQQIPASEQQKRKSMGKFAFVCFDSPVESKSSVILRMAQAVAHADG